MQIEPDTEVSLFVRDRVTGRLVFNPKAIEAHGFSPTNWRSRGTRWTVTLRARRLWPTVDR